MSDAATLSKALGWMLALGALAGCGESIPVDIFASKVAGKGECSAVDCQSIEDGRGAGSGGANTADAKPNEDARVGETPPKTTSAAGGASGGDRVDPGTGGSNAGTGRAGGGEAGSAGSSGGTDDGGATDDGGTVMTDAGQAFDGAPPDDVVLRDVISVVRAVRDACLPGTEVCDGLDNDCNGSVDERACPTGCIGASYLGSGYMLCYAQNQRRTWLEAETECQDRGMHLARVDDAEENAFIRRVARSVSFDGNLWLGGSDHVTEGRWIWTDGTQFWIGGVNGSRVGGSYTNWSIGQPNAGHLDADCTDMAQGGETWHDEQCGLVQAYMCQGN